MARKESKMPAGPPQVSGSYGVGGFTSTAGHESPPAPQDAKKAAPRQPGMTKGEAWAHAFGYALRPVLVLGILGLGLIYAKDEGSRRAVDSTFQILTYDPGDCPADWHGKPIEDPEL